MDDAALVSRRKRIVIISIEVVLILLVLVLLLATYLPAMIGGNPERP
jgi:hypothetical protein